jgi:Outer membrane protein beta-barrel domain
MRHKTGLVWLVGSVLVTVCATSAQAQDKRVFGSFGAGWTMPNGEVRDRLGDGFNITFGVEVKVAPAIGIEGLYSFNGLGQKQISIDVSSTPLPTPQNTVPTDFFGDMNMQYGTAAVVWRKPDGQVRPYGLAGLGIYYRPIKVTTPGVGYVPGYCDPWWYVCYPGGFVPVENILGKRSSTDFGIVFGGGVNMNVVFAEVRYHYIWGPEVEVPTGAQATDTRKANGQFLALTFGLRF